MFFKNRETKFDPFEKIGFRNEKRVVTVDDGYHGFWIYFGRVVIFLRFWVAGVWYVVVVLVSFLKVEDVGEKKIVEVGTVTA